MQINQLQRRTKLKKMARVGRGSKRGKTAGRGTKGQNARSGHRKRPEMRDIIKKLPKRRGRGVNIFQSFHAPFQPVNLAAIEMFFKEGETVNPQILQERGLVKSAVSPVKILGDGELHKKVTFTEVSFSHAAKKKLGMEEDSKKEAPKKTSTKVKAAKAPAKPK